jgi:hypothetical protein
VDHCDTFSRQVPQDIHGTQQSVHQAPSAISVRTLSLAAYSREGLPTEMLATRKDGSALRLPLLHAAMLISRTATPPAQQHSKRDSIGRIEDGHTL